MAQDIEAVAVRRHGQWLVSVPDLGISGTTRWLSKAGAVAQNLAAAHLGVDGADLTVAVTPLPSDEVAAAWTEGEELINQGKELMARGARVRADALRQWMTAEGLSVRDAAATLDLSPGRVQQIISS